MKAKRKTHFSTTGLQADNVSAAHFLLCEVALMLIYPHKLPPETPSALQGLKELLDNNRDTKAWGGDYEHPELITATKHL